MQLQKLGGICLNFVVEVLPPLRPLAVIDDQATDLALLFPRLVPHPVLVLPAIAGWQMTWLHPKKDISTPGKNMTLHQLKPTIYSMTVWLKLDLVVGDAAT